MNRIVNLDGTIAGQTRQFCEIGLDLLVQSLSCQIDTSDPDVVELILLFGITEYKRRIQRHEATNDQIKEQWSDMISNAFSNHEIGRQNRSVMLGVAQDAKNSLKPKKQK